MKKEVRTAVYDEELQIEAYRFEGIIQPFPNHFHEYYVIGFVEAGERHLSCRNREYVLEQGNIVVFNPGDNHGCTQTGKGTWDYRGLNISKEIMLSLAEEVTGRRELPGFSQNVIRDEEAGCYLRPLHEMVMKGTEGFGKEEALLFLISTLIQNCGQPFEGGIPELPKHPEGAGGRSHGCREIERACEYMERNYRSHICLEELCEYTALSKSTLLRAFTRLKGITPYRYLETIRINEAKKLLGQGVSSVDAAIQTGFSDQSHFTNYFSSFIGLSPGAYRDIFCDKR